ncbi:biotin/lipoyl-binding protein [Paucibacter sp. O1-1]|nr:biotin/lipoyl-binding protein [Paucibacter sp. O1-1]MDA3824358.1 biotin/lipoyl-binding protein [Paucibacter sp. O1-1]
MGINHRHSSAAGLMAVALLFAALAACTGRGCHAGGHRAGPRRHGQRRDVARRRAAAGAPTPTLAAQVGGNVVALQVKAGDRVKAGQPVARVDERELQAGVLRSEAGVAQAEAEWRNARLAAERARELRGHGFVSQAALDQADTALKAAQAGLAQAQAGRTQASLAARLQQDHQRTV